MPVIPVFSLSNIESFQEEEKLAAQIFDVCKEIGFFYVIDHGIDPETIRGAFQQAKELFNSDEKFALPYVTEANRGYISQDREVLSKKGHHDLKEAFNIGNVVEDPAWKHKNKWPSTLPRFRPVFDDFFLRCHNLSRRILRLFTYGLKVDRDFFDRSHHNNPSTMRLLHYPVVPNVVEVKDNQLRAGVHTDFGTMTLLFQDNNGGLEVLPRGSDEWISAKPIENAIVVNIGDLMMRWTNDVFKSTPHRVVVGSNKDRYSIAFFNQPKAETVVSCLPSCATEDNPKKYEDISSWDYLNQRLAEIVDKPE